MKSNSEKNVSSKSIPFDQHSSEQKAVPDSSSDHAITEGVIWKQLFIFFVPVLIASLLQQLYNTVDTITVGQFAGTKALSSVGGSSAILVNLVVGFFTGLSSGCSVIISQFYGAGDEKKLRTALHTAYAFSVAGGILFGILGILISPVLLRIMQTPEEIMDSSLLYTRIYFSGLIFTFIYNMGSAVFRAAGDSRRPLYYLIVCSVLNIALDLLLVCVFSMSVAGVAIATLISQAISALLIVRAQMRMRGGMHLDLSALRLNPDMLRRMLRIGLPAGLQSSMYSISNAIVQAHLNVFGVSVMAAWSAYGKIDGIFWMINSSFGISITTFAGQNFGARKPDRIRKGLRINLAEEFVVAILMSILLYCFGPELLGIFSTDPDVITTGMVMLKILSPFYFTFIFVEQFSGTLRAEGCVTVPTLITVCGVCLFRIIWLTWIIPGGSLEWIMYCYPLTWILCAVLMSVYYIYRQPRMLRTMGKL